ncbi:MAG TPA: hypothetical protein VKB38_22785 [Terracidiphilus sp.]|nr:hypothetical protein [Terracidiphilus sp.]
MIQVARFLTLAVALLPAALIAQQPAPAPSACPTTATLDDLIKAIDAAVSGPGNQDRTCFRALFLPETRLIPLRHLPDGSYQPRVLSVDDWIAAVAKRGSDSFTEKQIKVKSETYGHMAHLWSTYETLGSDGKMVDRGINSIQAVFDGKQWKVIQIVWQAETPTEKVPAQYLP